MQKCRYAYSKQKMWGKEVIKTHNNFINVILTQLFADFTPYKKILQGNLFLPHKHPPEI